MIVDSLPFFVEILCASVGIQLGIIFLPCRLCYSIVRVIHCLIIEFFMPDYEEAFLYNYTRPIIGLVLCEKCTALRSWPKGSRMRHFDDLADLEEEGTKGCWLCRAICMEFSQSQADRENPPALDRPEQLPSHSLLLWFAERTETGDGFLDHLRGKNTASTSRASAFNQR